MNPLRAKAEKMRRAGYSYNIILNKLDVSKSTLNNWLARVPFVPNKEVVQRVGNARLKSALFKHCQKLKSFETAKKEAGKEIGRLTKRDLLILGIGLYLGEGEKTFENVRIVNSDPKIIKLAIMWFKDIHGVKTDNFRPTIHLYPDNHIPTALNFWVEETGIPLHQFWESIIDVRKNKSSLKKRRLPYGTMHLHIVKGDVPYLGVKLHRKIQAQIEACLSQIKI